ADFVITVSAETRTWSGTFCPLGSSSAHPVVSAVATSVEVVTAVSVPALTGLVVTFHLPATSASETVGAGAGAGAGAIAAVVSFGASFFAHAARSRTVLQRARRDERDIGTSLSSEERRSRPWYGNRITAPSFLR